MVKSQNGMDQPGEQSTVEILEWNKMQTHDAMMVCVIIINTSNFDLTSEVCLWLCDIV